MCSQNCCSKHFNKPSRCFLGLFRMVMSKYAPIKVILQQLLLLAGVFNGCSVHEAAVFRRRFTPK